MLGEQKFVFDLLGISGEGLEGFHNAGLLEQLFLDPDGQCHAERLVPPRGVSQIGLKQPFELQERLFVEHDMVDFVQCYATFFQAIAYRLFGK